MTEEDEELLADFLEGYMEIHYNNGESFDIDHLTEKVLDMIQSLGYHIVKHEM